MTSGQAPGSAFSSARASLETASGAVAYYRLASLADHGYGELDRLPMTVKVLLEDLLRNAGNGVVRDSEIDHLARWRGSSQPESEFPFYPARVLLQDFTGVPATVDLAAMRSAMARLGGDPQRINPLVPCDLVIDHSVQVDFFGSANAFEMNVAREYERNLERYALLRWTQEAFENFRVVPPGRGIVHQVNLEYLATVVHRRTTNGQTVAMPDTLVGTDSHTTMVNGLGVLGWGSVASKPRRCCSASPCTFLLPRSWAFVSTVSCPKARRRPTWCLRSPRSCASAASSVVLWSSPGLGSVSLAWPIAQRSPTCVPNTAP